jgi:hypothetical protein
MKMVLPMILTSRRGYFKNPDKYEIKHIYRYEGDYNPDDEAIVLAIKPDQAKRCLCNRLAANSVY